MILTGASYASAGWMDNVPARFIPGRDHPGANQNLSQTLEPADSGMVTGSVHRAPDRSGHSPRLGRAGKP